MSKAGDKIMAGLGEALAYQRGFRAGIEAAAEHLESEAAEYRRRGRNLWSLDREVAANQIRALAPAAPEPSENEKAYLRDQTCILRKGKNGDTVICGQSVVEGHLRQGYQFDWKATDEARARDRAALAAGRV